MLRRRQRQPASSSSLVPLEYGGFTRIHSLPDNNGASAAGRQKTRPVARWQRRCGGGKTVDIPRVTRALAIPDAGPGQSSSCHRPELDAVPLLRDRGQGFDPHVRSRSEIRRTPLSREQRGRRRAHVWTHRVLPIGDPSARLLKQGSAQIPASGRRDSGRQAVRSAGPKGAPESGLDLFDLAMPRNARLDPFQCAWVATVRPKGGIAPRQASLFIFVVGRGRVNSGRDRGNPVGKKTGCATGLKLSGHPMFWRG